MGDFNNVTMGNGVLSCNGVDVGFLKGDVQYRYNYEIEDFKTGVPLLLRGSVTKELVSELVAPLAEFSAENFALALGGLTVDSTGAPVDVLDAANQERTFAAYEGGSLQAIVLDGPNVTGLVVKDVTEVTTYTVNDDYILDATRGVVWRNPGGAIGAGATVRVAYQYTPNSTQEIKLGVSFSLAQVAQLVFTHTRPNTKKRIVVNMPLFQASGQFEANFAEGNFLINNATFKAVFASAYPTYPMGRIQFLPAL